MGRIAALYCFPVKGMTAQPLPFVEAAAGEGFPNDRLYAFSRGKIPAEDYRTARPKTDFLMLMRDEKLAALDARFDAATGDRLTLASGGERLFDGALTDPQDALRAEQAVAAFMAPFRRDRPPQRPALLRFPGRRFTDVAGRGDAMMRAVSLINLASVRALEAAMGSPLDPLRFRANIYYDGARAWEEFEWIGRTVRIGGAAARAVLRTQRCAATNVDPATALRSGNVPQALTRAFNHADMGVYVELIVGGRVGLGDSIAPD